MPRGTASAPPKVPFPLRLRPDLSARIAKHAHARGLDQGPMAEVYLEEAVRMAEHPGIVFRDRPAGRRAGLGGHRLDVWEVVETVRNERGDEARAAKYLDVPRSLIASAVAYYAAYTNEIEGLIEANAALTADAEEAWRRRRTLLAR